MSDSEQRRLLGADLKEQCSELEKKLHMKELEKLDLNHNTLKLLKSQKKTIELLKTQIDNLKLTVRNVTMHRGTRRESEHRDYITRLLESQDIYKEEIKDLEEKLNEINKQMRDITTKFQTKEKEQAKNVNASVKRMAVSKAVELYTSKLERLIHRMDTLAQENCDLREKITTLLYTRQNLYSNFDKLRKTDTNCKKKIWTYLNSAVSAYHNREEFINKIEILKDRLHEDLEKVRTNKWHLARIKARDVKMQEFEDIKNQPVQDSRTAEIEFMVKKGITGLEQQVDDAKKMHAKILDTTGMDDYQEIVRQFELGENDNFNQFRYIGNIMEELHSLDFYVRKLIKVLSEPESDYSKEQRRSFHQAQDEKMALKDASHEAKYAIARAKKMKNYMREVLKEICKIYESVFKGRKMQDVKDIKYIDSEKIMKNINEIERNILEKISVMEYIELKKTGMIRKDSKDLPIMSKGLDINTFKVRAVSSVTTLIQEGPRSIESSNYEHPILKPLVSNDHFMKDEELKTVANTVIYKAEDLETHETPLESL